MLLYNSYYSMVQRNSNFLQSSEKQKEHTLQFQTIVIQIFPLFYTFYLWKILYRMLYNMCVLHEPMFTLQGWRLFQYLPLDWQSLPLDHFSSRLHFVSTCRRADSLFCWTVWVIGTYTPHMQSTGQMKYCWETLTSKLVIKTLI